MLVSHRKKFIYTKTAKTASTSVESFFEPYCMDPGQWVFAVLRDTYVSPAGIIGYRGPPNRSARHSLFARRWYDHMPASRMRHQLGRKIWDSYFKFCVVRNPFEKVISGFHFFERLGRRGQWSEIRKLPTLQAQFARWVETMVATKKILSDRNRYMINDKVCVDYFIRYECLSEGVQHVCERINVPFERGLRQMLRGYRPEGLSLDDYYDERTKEIVGKTYDFEIDYFGYQFPVTNRSD